MSTKIRCSCSIVWLLYGNKLLIPLVLSLFIILNSAPIAYAMFLTPVEIIDGMGDGSGNLLNGPRGTATDSSGNVFVTGALSDNVFKITPGGTITEIIDSAGVGGNALDRPFGVATDSSGNVFVAGFNSDNVFKIATPGTCSTGGTACTITEIIDSAGVGGNALDAAHAIATDLLGNVFVTGQFSDNAFKIATPGTCSTGGTVCTITEIIDSAGVGGNALDATNSLATDSSGNVFVAGVDSDNAFKIATPGTCSTGGTVCTITEIIDSAGVGGNALDAPRGTATDLSGNVFVVGALSDNAFKIATPGTCSTGGTVCTITEIIDSAGDGSGNTLDRSFGVATDSSGNVFVIGHETENAFKITTPGTCSTGGTACTITEIIDSAGDGSGNTLDGSESVETDSSGNVFVTGFFTDNAFKLELEAMAVGGELIPIDATAIVLAGTQTTAAWMIPVIVSAIGIAIVIARKF